jgi:hypothetical protein
MLTLFGIIFSAVYSGISSYYKTLSSNKKRKFKIIYPLITKFYVPWMSSASQLARNIDSVDKASLTTDALAHVLYLILVFYGYRLRFVREGGGYILLDSAADSLSVREAYSRVVASFDWAGANTALKTSKLQLIFLSKDTKKQPYVQYLFLQDLKDDAELQQMLLDLKNWIAEGKGRETAKRLWVFEMAFGESIDKFYSTWNP